MMRKSVVLPDPDGPSRATSVPAGASTVTLSRTTFFPNRLQMFFAVMLMRDPQPGRVGTARSYNIRPAGPEAAGYHVTKPDSPSTSRGPDMRAAALFIAFAALIAF